LEVFILRSVVTAAPAVSAQVGGERSKGLGIAPTGAEQQPGGIGIVLVSSTPTRAHGNTACCTAPAARAHR
jgi:hypothetical protein